MCKRSKVALVYEVLSTTYYWTNEWDHETRSWRPVMAQRGERNQEAMRARRSLVGRVRCFDWAECAVAYEARRAKESIRSKKPADAILRELHPAAGGTCRWCGEAIYRVNKAGQVVRHHSRMWHEAREVHPDAEREPDCRGEYYAQGFTFREQVFVRDRGVCATCGVDVPAGEEPWLEARRSEEARWEVERPSAGEEAFSVWWAQLEAARAKVDAWVREHPRPEWHADHIVPLEDGGAHLLANAATLCAPCHILKTAEENSARARRRRAENDLEVSGGTR